MMSEHPSINEERMFVLDQQIVSIHDPFSNSDLILDLGGGGEGVIGQLRGRQVVAIDRRKDELEDCASGPIKVVADAKELPLLDASFDAATCFFFLMYVPLEDRAAVLAEAFRVLRPGATLHIWDVTIPERGAHSQDLFVVPVRAELPGKTIQTGYGVPWSQREMSSDSVAGLAQQVGFTLIDAARAGETFYLTLSRS